MVLPGLTAASSFLTKAKSGRGKNNKRFKCRDREKIRSTRHILDEGGDILAQSETLRSIPVAAHEGTRVVVNIENGIYHDLKASQNLTWDGVRVDGEGRVPVYSDEKSDVHVD